MKRLLYNIVILFFICTSCEQKNNNKPVDLSIYYTKPTISPADRCEEDRKRVKNEARDIVYKIDGEMCEIRTWEFNSKSYFALEYKWNVHSTNTDSNYSSDYNIFEAIKDFEEDYPNLIYHSNILSICNCSKHNTIEYRFYKKNPKYYNSKGIQIKLTDYEIKMKRKEERERKQRREQRYQ